MTKQLLDGCGTIQPTPDVPLIELRGASGRLYGRLNVVTLIIEVKRKGEPAERIDLRPYLQAVKT